MSSGPREQQVARLLALEMQRLYGVELTVTSAASSQSSPSITLVLAGSPEGTAVLEKMAGKAKWPPPRNAEEGYLLEVGPHEAIIFAQAQRGLVHGCQTLLQLVEATPNGRVKQLLGTRIADYPQLGFRGVHICIFPNTELAAVRQMILLAARFKYNAVVIEFWSSLQSKKRPETAYENAYRPEQIRPLVLLGHALGMEMIPMLNSWGHASGMRRRSGEHVVLDRYRRYKDLYEPDGWSFCLSNPRIYDHLFDRYEELLELFAPVHYFHLGLDEAWGHLGLEENVACRGDDPLKLITRHLEDYAILAARLEEAKRDPMCHGLVLWSEISHNDTFMLEYLAANNWQPQSLDAAAAAQRFCQARYPGKLAASMDPVWSKFLVTSQTANWSMRGTQRVVLRAPQFHLLTSPRLTFTPQRIEELLAQRDKLRAGLEPAPEVRAELAALTDACYDNPLWRRDALDMARTIANRALLVTLMDAVDRMEAWRRNESGDPEAIRRLARLNQRLLDALCDVLALSDDHSMAASLQRLQEAVALNGVAPTLNPHTEQTLKGNAENDYCRSHHYELAKYVYRGEAAVFWDYVRKQLESGQRIKWGGAAGSAKRAKSIEDQFFATPLAEMAPHGPRNAGQFVEAVNQLEVLIEQYLATRRTAQP